MNKNDDDNVGKSFNFQDFQQVFKITKLARGLNDVSLPDDIKTELERDI